MSKSYSKRQKQVRKTPWFNPDKVEYKKFVDPKEYRACTAKTAFKYESEALHHAEHLKERGDGRELLVWTTYHCPFCKKWHLSTNQTPHIRQAALARKHSS